MASPDAYVKALSALVTACFALVILRAHSRRSSTNLWLGVFLLLIAGNQGAEAMRALASSEVARLEWYRYATVFAAFDPAALYMFAAAHREGPRLDRPAALVAALAPAALLALFAGWGLDAIIDTAEARAYSVLLGAYTAAVYVVVFAWAVRMLVVERRGGQAWPWMLSALALVALLALARAGENVATYFTYPERSALIPYLVSFLLALAVAGVLVGVLMRTTEGVKLHHRRVVARSMTFAFLVVLALYLNHYVWRLPIGLTPNEPLLLAIGRIGAPLRWLLFGAFVSIATLRHDALGLDIAARRRAARLLIGLSLAVAAATPLLLVANTADGGSIPLWAIILFGAALVVSQGFRTLVDKVAHKAYGVPMPGDVAARHEAYRAAVAEALAQGRAPMRDADLARLRQELEIDDLTAGVLEQVADASTTAPLAPGQVVGRRYHIQRLLGRGGAGRAFLARDLLLSRDVAVKEVLHGFDADAGILLDEARLAGAIEHPNVVRVYDVLPRSGASLVVQEYVAGGTLEDRLRREGGLAPTDALDLAEALLSGLAAVHARGVVHRDLKPANVLLTSEGSPKIADFGIASGHSGATVPAHAPVSPGTPGYASPEQMRGEPATPASDVYAVVQIVRACLREPPAPALQELLARASSPDPKARPVDARAMLEALREARAAARAPRSRSRN